MDVKEAIEKRRAYRSFAPVEITDAMIEDFAKCAQLAMSCNNNQPWRLVFTRGKEALNRLFEALPPGNAWVKSASLIIAVFSKKEKDCLNNKDGREYFLFDLGIATAFIVLRATEMGLIAHPIAGFDQEKAKQALYIPDEYTLITIINVGKKSDTVNPILSDNMKLGEQNRPPRLELNKIYSIDKYSPELGEEPKKV
jgi:nitroreductase